MLLVKLRPLKSITILIDIIASGNDKLIYASSDESVMMSL